MQKGIRIGTIFDIDIRIDWSWFLIFLLVTWNLSSALGRFHSDWGPSLRWGLSAGAALLFFGSVLTHELAHSLLARSRGIPIQSITLHLFGGVANIQREPDSPGVEFWMAIVGPITSLVIGQILLLIASVSGGPIAAINNPSEVISRLSPLRMLLLWLGSVNTTLGLFNLIPGFPLDGGRVLRSILWAISDDLRRATRWASWVGQGIAWLMILGGVSMAFGAQIPVFGSGFVNGLWLAFIGWFLNSASVRSYQRVVIEDILQGMSVERLMRIDPPTVSPDISVASLVNDHLMGTDDHAFPVLEQDQVVGVVTLEDVRSIPRNTWGTTSVRDIMTPKDKLIATIPQEDAAEALQKLSHGDVRLLPVLRDGALAGVLRRRDIIRWLQLNSEAL